MLPISFPPMITITISAPPDKYEFSCLIIKKTIFLLLRIFFFMKKDNIKLFFSYFRYKIQINLFLCSLRIYRVYSVIISQVTADENKIDKDKIQ